MSSFNAGQSEEGIAGVGGNGGAITLDIDGKWGSIADGLNIASIGGQGGGGNYSGGQGSASSPQGVDAAYGGDAGAVNVTVRGTVAGNGYGAAIQSVGGAGGAGGNVDNDDDSSGGQGGKGGKGGNVIGTLVPGATVESNLFNAAAFYVASIGGTGGTGGNGNNSAKGGIAGDAGTASAVINGTATTDGEADTYGVLVQSLGGLGGNGGHSSAWFNPVSGAGNKGGQASTATITGEGAIVQTGTKQAFADNSAGVVVQSIGGGGGVGPDSNGWFAVGGNGGTAANGSTSSVTLTNSRVVTWGFNSAAIIAQSIGGGGGKGGDATGTGGVVQMVVGGTGGAGGAAADANAAFLTDPSLPGFSQIQTLNKHSPGLQIQSIGGGGGDGGSGYGKSYSLFYGASISVGGAGGAGGNGGTVNAARTENNSGQIETFDSDSYGIVGQSIGGGGGNGGASIAKSIVKAAGSSEFPSQSLALATGGSGGVAGSARDVYLQNSGLIATTGGGSVGIVAQAIGGGGGNGGDASATASASGKNITLAVSVAHGGTGGAAGDGGYTYADGTHSTVEAMNHGLVVTVGESAQGLLVQSIGGGGGNGGAGDAKTANGSSVLANQSDGEGSTPKSLGIAIGSAGSGGGAGKGFNATATNTGAILTTGDGSHGIQVQTIGGGGGNAGGGAASTSGDIQFGLSVGGSGGDGGDTYYTGQINVTNGGDNGGGTIVTFGADANAILAQSIGGGGGAGGKGGTNISGGKSDKAGGNGDAAGINSTLGAIEGNFASKGVDAIGDYNTLSSALTTINGLLGNDSLQVGLGDDDPGDDLDETASSGGDDSDDNNAKSIGINVAVGGSGGKGGSGGFITVTNQASAVAATTGKMADAIVAQSIGGGGGKGGAASTAASTDISGSVAVGGTGGSGGNGGEPYVNNQGQVYTIGALSAGIVAQSVGGGGGIGGASATTASNDSAQLGDDDKTYSLGVSVGGNGGKNGIGEGSKVDSSGAIQTRGHDSIGIIAQSIAGGGGIVKTLATDLDNNGGSATASSSKDYAINFQFGGKNGASGNSGAAIVNTTLGGTIDTRGDNSYGILAQSIAGGGGLALGGKPNGTSAADFFGSGTMTGNVNIGIDPNPDNNMGVQVAVGDNITTQGKGAVGVWAQSIGGGGGIAGDTGWTGQVVNMGRGGSHTGSGGDMQISVAANATVFTGGSNAPGIIAQTIGGGGGWVTNKNGAYVGSAGGTGLGGLVNIDVQGVVNAVGPASPGIFAQSAGGGSMGGVGDGHTITINVGSASNTNATVLGGNGFGLVAAAIRVEGGSYQGQTGYALNTITNYGKIGTNDQSGGGYALFTENGTTTVNNYGNIDGNNSVEGSINNYSGATLTSGATLDLKGGTLTNAGVINVGGKGPIARTELTGNLVQLPGGQLNIDADLRGGAGDRLEISGKATIAGTVAINPISVSNKSLTVLTATGGVSVDPALGSTDNSQLFDFKAQAGTDGKSLVIQPSANLASAASTLGNNRQAAAGNLQSLFDSGASFDRGFNALLGVNDPASYARSLDALSGQALGALGAFRINSSRAFVGNLYGGCDRHGVVGVDGHCLWARAFYTSTTQDENTDELGYHASATGFQLGGETQLSDSWYLSGAVAYEHSRFRDDDRTARVKGDGLLGGVSLRYATGKLELSGALDAGYGWYQSRRQIGLGGLADQARAKPNQWEVGAHANAAYAFDLGATGYARPYADLHVIHVHSQRFAETGNSPFNLAVDAQSQTAVAGGVGLEVGGRIPLKSGGTLRPFASAGVELASNSDWTTTARFVGQAGGDSFDIRTAAPNTYGRFAVGLELLGAKNVDLSLSYNPEVGKDYVSHSGLAKLTYRF